MNSEAKRLSAKECYDINDLISIVRLLRSPDGCPWDREQTHSSVRNDFIEETYEVIEALDKKDMSLLREELGDVLLQVVFHSVIEEECGSFGFDEVVNDICAKLVLRHPHVFGDVDADTSEKVLKNWDKIKQKSKGQTTVYETLESVCSSLPALLRSQKTVKRADKGGYGDIAERYCDSERLGDKLLYLTYLAYRDGINAEEALSESVADFVRIVKKEEERE